MTAGRLASSSTLRNQNGTGKGQVAFDPNVLDLRAKRGLSQGKETLQTRFRFESKPTKHLAGWSISLGRDKPGAHGARPVTHVMIYDSGQHRFINSFALNAA